MRRLRGRSEAYRGCPMPYASLRPAVVFALGSFDGSESEPVCKQIRHVADFAVRVLLDVSGLTVSLCRFYCRV